MHVTVTKPKRRAYTLVELVTVIVLLGILSLGVVAPTMSYINTMRVRAASSRIAADIRYLQRLSLGSGLCTWLVVSQASNNYTLYMENPSSLGKAGRQAITHPFYQSSSAVALGTGPFVNVSITGVSFNATSELEFDNFGVPCDSTSTALTATGTITLTGGTQVKVYPVGGFVERTN